MLNPGKSLKHAISFVREKSSNFSLQHLFKIHYSFSENLIIPFTIRNTPIILLYKYQALTKIELIETWLIANTNVIKDLANEDPNFRLNKLEF